jgi:hypothetical protein
LCLSAVLLWGSPYQFNSVFASDTEEEQKGDSPALTIRNHKSEPVEVRMVEHLYRWTNWDILKNSDPFKRLDSRTVEFIAQIPPGGEKTVSYKVHYGW